MPVFCTKSDYFRPGRAALWAGGLQAISHYMPSGSFEHLVARPVPTSTRAVFPRGASPDAYPAPGFFLSAPAPLAAALAVQTENDDLSDLANAGYGAGDYPAAVDPLRRVLNLNRDSAAAHQGRGEPRF
jgi:hypothetical protein